MAAESAGYTTDPDEQPFSPSVFLNLPPTPPHDDGQDDPAASSSSDDLVLPFISRILMADDDKLSYHYQYPDHQEALLRAQQPFAEILSDTTTSSSSSFSGGAGGASGVGEHKHNSLFSGGGGHQMMTQQIRVTMDMLNQAYLKGMEEATKFLPANNILLVHSAEATRHSSISDRQWKKNKGIVDGTITSSMLQESGSGDIVIACNKKHHNNWDSLEVEMSKKMTDLSIAVISPESDETEEKIVDVDRFILIKYQSLLYKMMGSMSCITVDDDTEAEKKNTNKGKRKSSAVVMSNNIEVDLRA